MNSRRPILLIEDSDDDYVLFQHLLASAKVEAPLERSVSANRAIERYASVAIETAPSLVFTDLTMPDGDGFEFLTWARAQAALRDTLLVVLSSTRRGADIDKAYGLGAHFFLSKFPNAPMLAQLCAAAEKKDLALQTRLAGLKGEAVTRIAG
jgi:CheY-like chemotaxis protein